MDDDLVAVAVIDGNDRKARWIVERELAPAGIPCFLEGSVVYGVQVRSRDVARAREILTTSKALKDHWVQFPPD